MRRHATAGEPPENTRLADRILVMDQGRVIEQGTYEDLANADGLFAELIALAQDR